MESAELDNQQRPWKPYRDPSDLAYTKIWYTIQGEGPFTGMRSIFIRFAGCNLQCPLCDTDYTSNVQCESVEIVAAKLKAACEQENCELVVITGGEPLRQAGIVPLVDTLLTAQIRVQIETNGTMFQPFDWFRSEDWFRVVCSPKGPKINPLLDDQIHAMKYVLAADEMDEQDGLPGDVLGIGHKPARPREGFPRSEIYIQPLDDGSGSHFDPTTTNSKHLQAALYSVDNFGYRLGFQLHKYIGRE